MKVVLWAQKDLKRYRLGDQKRHDDQGEVSSTEGCVPQGAGRARAIS